MPIRATLDWSWELLGPDEQSALAQLTVFEGSFSLDAAEAVLSLAELWPVDAVQALVDKSLVRRLDEARFDLLSSVQAYAAEKLTALGQRADAEGRHGLHFAKLGTHAAVAALNVHGGVARRQALAQELGNLEAACRRAVASGDSAVAVATLEAAGAVLALQGPFQTWASLADSVAAMTHPPQERARVARLLGDALHAVGQGTRADAAYEEALALDEAAGNRAGAAQARYARANRACYANRLNEAQADYEAALELLRLAPDRVQEGLVRGSLGELLRMQGRLSEALPYVQQALAIHREVGNRRAEAVVLVFFANAALVEGRMEEAAARYEEALDAARALNNRHIEAMALFNLSVVCAETGAIERGHALAEQALRLHREIGNRRSEGLALGQVGRFAVLRGAHAAAAAHYTAALALHRELGNRRGEASTLAEFGSLEQARGRPAEARAYYEQALCIAREVRHPRLEGAVFALLAVSLAEEGTAREAREALASGEALLEAAADLVEIAKLTARRAQVEAMLGDRHAAVHALAEAEARAATLGLNSESEVHRTIRQCAEAIGRRASG